MTPARPIPLTRDLVLIGGGHAHALLLKRWGMRPLPGARLTLINPAPSAPYTGMLPGYVAGHYGRDELEIDLVRLARHARARMIFGIVIGIDREAKTIQVADRPPIAYDIASFDIGITSYMPDLPGFSTHGVAAKPLGPYALRWHAFLTENPDRPVAVIGGGAGGVELALAMRHRLSEMGRGAGVTLIETGIILSEFGPVTRARLRRELERAGVDVIENTTVEVVGSESVALGDGREIPSAFTVGAAGARPFDWLEETGLDLTEGYITVDETLRSTSDKSIYATGDCAHMAHAPRPKAGVFAVRAAPVLAHNLRAALSGSQRKPFRPQKHYLKLISLGRRSALAEKWGHSIGGDWAWTWKDRIDRRFMDRLADLPPMPPPAPPRERAQGVIESIGPKPLCGGCGAKVGTGVLDGVLAGLPAMTRDDVETGAGDDAAVLRFENARQVISTDHLRSFWDDPFVMARIAALHALGDVWAMGAAPQSLLAHIILPEMVEAKQRDWLTEIMRAASQVAAEAGAGVVGGHTTVGAELTIGFTVTGLLDGPPVTQAGARADDALLLTRPIGSGTIMAGEMQRTAKGRDVQGALVALSRAQGDAAAFLAPLASAMTDVTGFGLAGHLGRMADAAGLTAEVSLKHVPFLAGAEDLARQGVRSSLYPANRAAVLADAPDTPQAALLFDPQTSGGLLAALPTAAAEKALEQIKAHGHPAAIIGRMTAYEGVTLRAL
ncbi:MAG: selenide, water dikinase SelD [Paracoccaceae bacterium]|nr:selenide, water dikinase SelD [Paracoccaceae bacterium]